MTSAPSAFFRKSSDSVAPKWLYERTRKNGVPCRRLGKYVRFSDDDLAAIVANAFVPTANGSINANCCIVQGDDRDKTHSQGQTMVQVPVDRDLCKKFKLKILDSWPTGPHVDDQVKEAL
jgi:hypothetical protein